jgi:deoxyadenosine/deoxycytidine kinase
MEIRGLKKVTSMNILEGNVAAGKSYLLNAVRKYIEDNNLSALHAPPQPPIPGARRDLFLILDEPVNMWCEKNCSLLNCNDEGTDRELYSSLGLFYKGQDDELYEQNPWAFDFQVDAFTSRVDNTAEQLDRVPEFSADSNTRVHVISERSLRTDRLFFKNVYESGKVARHQWQKYERFHATICRETLKKEDTMIYVRTSPEKCHSRMYTKRKREAEVENMIPLSYFESLHKAHEEMAIEFRQEKGSDSVVELDFNRDMTPEEIASFAARLIHKVKMIQ